MQRPSLGAILLGLVPFVATCFSVPLWDRVYPMILGLPFNFFWLISWLLLTPLCMRGACQLEERAQPKSGVKKVVQIDASRYRVGNYHRHRGLGIAYRLPGAISPHDRPRAVDSRRSGASGWGWFGC